MMRSSCSMQMQDVGAATSNSGLQCEPCMQAGQGFLGRLTVCTRLSSRPGMLHQSLSMKE